MSLQRPNPDDNPDDLLCWATVKIVTPSIRIDLRWIPPISGLAQYTEGWWSPLALRGMTGSEQGLYTWWRGEEKTLFWVPVHLPGGVHQRGILSLSRFNMPPRYKQQGPGRLSDPRGGPTIDVAWVMD